MGIAQNASIMYRDAITLFLYLLILNSVWQTQLMRNDFKEHELMNDNWEISTTTIQKVTTTMSAVITTTFYERVGNNSIISDHHHSPSSRIAVR
jgi:hypothetical protein